MEKSLVERSAHLKGNNNLSNDENVERRYLLQYSKIQR